MDVVVEQVNVVEPDHTRCSALVRELGLRSARFALTKAMATLTRSLSHHKLS